MFKQSLQTPAAAQSDAALHWRLSALQAANFAGIGIYLPFMPAWLASRGLSDQLIGFTLALGMILRMLAAQPATALGDGRFGAVRVLIMLQLILVVVYVALANMPSHAALIAMMGVVAVVSAGVIPLGDHLAVNAARARRKLAFGRMRLWGSVAFLAMSAASGPLVATFGVGVIPYALALSCLIAAAVAAFAPDVASRPEHGPGERAAAPPDGAVRVLWAAMIGSGLINASHAALYAFGTLYWRSLAIPDSFIGVLWAVGVAAEIVLMYALGRVAEAGLRRALALLLASGIVAMLRFAIMPSVTSPELILLLQLSHAVTFGAQLLGVMTVVAILAPAHQRALSQGRMTAVNAFLMGAATLGVGQIYALDKPSAFLAMTPLAAVGCGFVIWAWRKASALGLDSRHAAALPVPEPSAARPD
jgi:MFS transporter, PPP family, 3-phenylpropionic acid transporter